MLLTTQVLIIARSDAPFKKGYHPWVRNSLKKWTEEMTVELELDDGTNVTCAIITILEVEGKGLHRFDAA